MAQKKTKGKAPTHIVYSVQERDKDQSGIWTRIGAVWPHDDGKGFNIQLNLLPPDGRLTIRDVSTQREAQ